MYEAKKVEHASKNLENEPAPKALLIASDALPLEKIGLISGEMTECMNLVLQAMRGNTTFFRVRGVCCRFVGNGDNNQ